MLDSRECPLKTISKKLTLFWNVIVNIVYDFLCNIRICGMANYVYESLPYISRDSCITYIYIKFNTNHLHPNIIPTKFDLHNFRVHIL